MSRSIAVLNAGSSSIKFAFFADENELRLTYRGLLEQIGVSPHLSVTDAGGAVVGERSWPSNGFDHKAATREILKVGVEIGREAPVAAVGHRVVHGGERHAAPIRVDRTVFEDLAKLTPLAPLHQPHNLAPIATLLEAAPHIPQVACFDTAFHRSQPPLAQMFALPRRFTAAGVRRYGFHGLSYEYVAGRLREVAPEIAGGRVIIAHLGNGASLCAVRDGRSVASTMGFTAADGLVMGTRCGAMDPGAMIHLMDAYGMGARELEDLIYKRSGLLGVSGVSSDMRALHASHEQAAKEAIDLFVYRVVREVGSLAAALGGLDGLVFTGGIGEHDAEVRAEIGAGCRWLGVLIDPTANATGVGRISPEAAPVRVLVLPTDEEQVVARQTRALL
jgi:acetate kinase